MALAIPKGDPGPWLAARLKPGDTFVDVGANIGRIAGQVATAIGDTGRIFAVEPDSRCWPDLAKVPNIGIHRCAAGRTTGVATLTLGHEPSHSALRREVVHKPEGSEEITVVDLSTLIRARPIAAVKIDVQGSELDVLAGASELLPHCSCWVIEIWPWGLPDGAQSVAALYELLSGNGFRAYSLDTTPDRVFRAELVEWAEQAEHQQHVNLAFLR